MIKKNRCVASLPSDVAFFDRCMVDFRTGRVYCFSSTNEMQVLGNPIL